MDRNNEGELEYMCDRGNVRPFIAQRSDHLSNVLFAGKTSVEYLLEVINEFAWKRKCHNKRIKSASKRAYEKKKQSGVKTIKARELTKKSDWGTVK